MDSKYPLVLKCSGFIQTGNFMNVDNIYCRYSFVSGVDWSILGGIDIGLSQTSSRSPDCAEITWNFPIDVTFKATNIFGWPRIVLSVYGIDFLGRDVIRGYGSALIPLSAGSHDMTVEMFIPLASSPLNNILSWLLGDPPEFYDTKIVGLPDGREVTRIKKTGSVKLILNVNTKGFQDAGYSVKDN